jgi:tight adherence protein B
MGALVGLLFGAGVALVWWALVRPQVSRHPAAVPRARVREMLAQAGIENVTPGSLFASCCGTGLVAFLAVASLSRSVVIGLFFGAMAGYVPVALVRYRHRRRRVELRQLWPDVVDNLASAVRAGMSLPEALSQLAVRGPEELRRPFQRFAEDYRATGRFVECLDRLKASLADPVGDRIIESLRMAREVGGSDLGRLLRTLSSFPARGREDPGGAGDPPGLDGQRRTTGRGVPVDGLALLSVNPESAAAYNTPAGFLVLLGGAVVCLASYRVMLRIGRLPDEERVLR